MGRLKDATRFLFSAFTPRSQKTAEYPQYPRSLRANSSFGTVRLKLCLNFTPWLRAVFTPPCKTFAANFVYVGKAIFF